MIILRTLRYAVLIAFRPGCTTDELLIDTNRLRYAIIAWLVIGILYGLAAYIGGLNGFGAVSAPWLPIPAEQYYLWMGPATPLIYLITFLIQAGLIQLLAKPAHGEGNYEDTFAISALTFFLPVFLTMWLFEMPLLVLFPHWRRYELGGLGWMPEWLDTMRQMVGVIWIFIILHPAVSRVQRISLWKAIPITTVAFILAWAVTMTYLR